jgi:hypothetical protein
MIGGADKIAQPTRKARVPPQPGSNRRIGLVLSLGEQVREQRRVCLGDGTGAIHGRA